MNKEELALLEEIDEIRRLAGMPKLDEVSRRSFMKGAGAAAASMAVPGIAKGSIDEWAQYEQEIKKRSAPEFFAALWQHWRPNAESPDRLMKYIFDMLEHVNQWGPIRGAPSGSILADPSHRDMGLAHQWMVKNWNNYWGPKKSGDKHGSWR